MGQEEEYLLGLNQFVQSQRTQSALGLFTEDTSAAEGFLRAHMTMAIGMLGPPQMNLDSDRGPQERNVIDHTS